MPFVAALILLLAPGQSQQSIGLAVLEAVDHLLKTTHAASATGHIRGRVFDEYGASIPDGSVSFEPVDPRSGLMSFRTVADSRGRFDFIGVRPGTYRITAKVPGFETTIMVQEVPAGMETDVTVVVRRRYWQ